MGAFVLTKMKETAEAFLGQPVSKAVITVPGGCCGLEGSKQLLGALVPYFCWVIAWFSRCHSS